MKERPKHTEAFQYFFTLLEKGHTPTDSVKATAEHCDVIPRTVWKWYKEFDWERRSDIKRQKIVEEMEREEIKTLAQNRLNYLNILHKLLDDMIKDGFPVKIESVKDLEVVFKTALLLQNAPTEVTKNSNVNVHMGVEEFDENLIDKIIAEEMKAEAELKAELQEKYEAIEDSSDMESDEE